MNAREERGLVIAATQRLTNKGKVWLVPSQSGRGKYTVCPDPENPFCSCPDHEETGGVQQARFQGTQDAVDRTPTLPTSQHQPGAGRYQSLGRNGETSWLSSAWR